MSDHEYIQGCADRGDVIPNGSYLVDRQIQVRGPLIGQSRDGVVLTSNRHVTGGLFVLRDGARCVRNMTVIAPHVGTVIGSDSSAVLRNVVIEDVSISGSLGVTSYLIDISNEGPASASDVCIRNCELGSCGYGIRLRGRVSRAAVIDCEVVNWRYYGILLRARADVGPSDVLIEGNRLHRPSLEASQYARQMICCLGDPQSPSCNMHRIKIVGNTCRGLAKPYEHFGTGDQIVLHYCSDFVVTGNQTLDGGENGLAVSVACYRGVVSNNVAKGNDAHGFHISTLRARSFGIDLINNVSEDNAIRADGADDIMAGFYIQNAAFLNLISNTVVDTCNPRRHKYGFLIGSSRNVFGFGNRMISSDPNGVSKLAVFQSNNVEVEVFDEVR